jgi:hypothetical protein
VQEGVIIDICSYECLVSLGFGAVRPEVLTRDLIEILEGKALISRIRSDCCASEIHTFATIGIDDWFLALFKGGHESSGLNSFDNRLKLLVVESVFGIRSVKAR